MTQKLCNRKKICNDILYVLYNTEKPIFKLYYNNTILIYRNYMNYKLYICILCIENYEKLQINF